MRVAKTQAATLTHTFYLDETETDATGNVVVTVADANGDTVSTGNATHAGAGTGRYSYVLPGQADVAELTVSWAATVSGTAVVEQDLVSIVGRHLFTLAEGRASDTSLADEAKYTTDDLRTARDEVEDELEAITLRAWTTRYRRVVLDGTGHPDLILGDLDITAIRAASMAPRLDETFVALTSGQLAALSVLPDGTLRRADDLVWTYGNDNIVVEYEYGATSVPADLKKAALLRFRTRLNLNKSGIPDRALSFTSADGGNFRLSTPGAYQTGQPEVDAVYWRYSRRASGSGKARPASRTLDYNPQAYSLFHGGRR